MVAAGAVVTRNASPGAIVVGIPAKPIGSVMEPNERRREQLSRMPQFGSAESERDDLSADKDQELRDVGEKCGGCLLV